MKRLLPPATAMCRSCERPAPPLALTCPYCSEDLSHRCQRLWLGLLIPAVAGCGAILLLLWRGGLSMSGAVTLPGSLLTAAGLGLALIPPDWPGVAGATRRIRLWQLLPRYAGGLALTLATTLTLCAIRAPTPWTPATTALATITGLALLPSTMLLGLSWHPLTAGLLLAAGWLLPT
jgi:hypothetical protein